MKGKAVKKRTNRLIPKFAAGIAATLVVMCSFGGFPGRCVEAYEWNETPALPVAEEVIYINDGTGIGLSGGFSVADGGLSGSGISIGKSSYLTQTFKRFDTEIAAGAKFFRHGRAMISFDVKASDTEHALVFAINDEAASSAAVVMNGAGKMYFNMRKAWPTANYLPECARDYIPGRWYNIKILADTENRRLVYFLDNEYWGEYRLESSKALNTKIYPELKIKEIFFNYHPDWKMENGVQTSADGSGEFVIDNLTYAIPRFDDAELICEIDNTGNIMYKGDSSLKYYAVNDTAYSKSLILKYDIRSADNRTSQKGERKISVPAKSETQITVEADTERNGFYTAYAELLNAAGVRICSTETRFSVVADTEVMNGKVGFSAHPMTHSVGSCEETIDVTAALGGALLREDYPWSLMYKTDGTTKIGDWTWLTSYPKLTDAAGQKLLAILSPGDDNMAGAAWPITEDGIKNTDALSLWEGYCTDLAKLLKDYDVSFEVYNEWAGQAQNKTKATPKAYAEVLKASAAGLRAGNPNAHITAFCCFYSDAEWLDAALGALGENPGQYFDSISVHPYMAYWSGLLYPEGEFISGMEEITSVLEKYGVGDKSVYATEYGFSTGYSVSDGTNKIYPINESLKAAYNARMLIMGEKYFDKTYLYTVCNKVKDESGASDITEREYEAGLGFTASPYGTEIPYEAYPSAVALAGYNMLFTGAELIGSSVEAGRADTSDDDIYVYRFKLADGRQAAAVWSLKDEREVSVSFGTDTAEIYDMYGNKKSLNAYNGYLTLRISAEPKYITAESLSAPTFADTARFGADKTAETQLNGSFDVNVTAPTDKSFKASAQRGNNTYTSIATVIGGAAVLRVNTGSNVKFNPSYNFGEIKNAESIAVLIGDGDKTYFNEEVLFTYSGKADNPSTETDFAAYAFDNDKWRSIMEKKESRQPSVIEKEKESGKLFFRVLH